MLRLLRMLPTVGPSHQTIMHLACDENLERNDPALVPPRHGCASFTSVRTRAL